MSEIARRSMEEVMEQIGSDPIITFYLKMSQPTEHETLLPMYNETQLRLAFKQIRPHTAVRPNEVQLYSRLLLFYYARKYRSMDQLLSIMTTFSEQDIIDCFDRFNQIRSVWYQFIRKYLLYYMNREAFNAILYEWSRRYYLMNGQLLRNMLEIKAMSLIRYLCWDAKYFKTWLKVFNNKLLCVNLMKETADLKDVTEVDLCTSNIVMDIQHKFNKLMMDFVVPFKTIKKPNQFELQVAIPTMKAKDFLVMPPKVVKPPTPVPVEKYKASEGTANSLVARSAPDRCAAENADGFQSVQETTRRTRTSATSANTSKFKLSAETEQSPPAVKKQKIEVLKVEVLKPEPIVYNAAIEEEPISLKDEAIVGEMNLASDIKSEITIDESESDVEIELGELEEVSDTEMSSSFCSVDGDEEEREEEFSGGNDELPKTHYELPKTIDYRSAISHISALQGYAVSHGHFDAILLLDKVDTIFRKSQNK